ncbi:CsbD family protein [Fundicoccus sp. Sow4_H7]|uniref:CsbD family protein n=1 Tax=Fundicoccus sp. Sow4_H7 TaxID=3438784 RepID=UPI003F8EE7E5
MKDDKRDQFEGKAKEVAGKLTGDKKTEAEGKTQNEGGKLKERINDASDSVKGAVEGVKESFDNDDEKKDR